MGAQGGHNHMAGLAVGYAALAAVLAAADAVLVRMLDGAVHPLMIGFTRALFGALAVLPLVALRPGLLRSAYPLRQHLLRAGLKLLAMVCFFAAFAQGPLTDVTAIAFTSPVFVVLGAALMLGERLSLLKTAALALGLAGALLIVSPAGAGLSWAIGFALVGAVVQAVIQIMLKSMSAGDSTATLVVLNLLLTVPVACVLALPVMAWPAPGDLALLAVQGVAGAACMALMTHAFSLADASIVAPVDFLRLPLVALAAYAVFAEVAGPATWVGGAMICAAALTISRAGRPARP